MRVHRFYNDGFGPLWIYRDASGLVGVVRAQTWEDAYSCCEDEIFSDGDPADFDEEDRKLCEAEGTLPEGYGHRPNGRGMHEWNKSSIYSTDLNGESLSLLTREEAVRLDLDLADVIAGLMGKDDGKVWISS